MLSPELGGPHVPSTVRPLAVGGDSCGPGAPPHPCGPSAERGDSHVTDEGCLNWWGAWRAHLTPCPPSAGHLLCVVVLVLPVRSLVKLYLHLLTGLLLGVGHTVAR